MEPELLRAIDPEEYFDTHQKHGIRPDGRNSLEYREINVHTEVFESSFGSSIVSFGKTKFSCAISLMMGKPSTAESREGEIGRILVLVTAVSLGP